MLQVLSLIFVNDTGEFLDESAINDLIPLLIDLLEHNELADYDSFCKEDLVRACIPNTESKFHVDSLYFPCRDCNQRWRSLAAFELSTAFENEKWECRSSSRSFGLPWRPDWQARRWLPDSASRICTAVLLWATGGWRWTSRKEDAGDHCQTWTSLRRKRPILLYINSYRLFTRMNNKKTW